MKKLTVPAFDAIDVFDTCVSGLDNPDLAERFKAARDSIIELFLGYTEKASTSELYCLPLSAHAKPDQEVVATLTKKEFMSLYSNQLLNKGKAARTYYDKLIISAPLAKCPLCGFGQATTLDHFLSKARYPAYSILPINLVPACTDCNKVKGACAVTEANQQSHLYFECVRFEKEPWVFAELVETTPPTIRYFAEPPGEWPDPLKLRAKNHFKNLDLARRFGIEAAAELSGMIEVLDDLETCEDRKDHLKRFASSERKNRANHWKAPMYEALSESQWFQSGGYKSYI
ncbi:hypothetical protein ALO87_100719 [Pseudomonas syringae pv. apii]|uniref:HNH endonuclease n=1 Tax=Pseudomonas syringae group genomosp. 3 TaxID=251701 RepID=UPI0006E54FFF|nr:HNH endonuclease [Pseudomonas syringae group genomosp. 3]KPW35163.1 hypothetical protein ALO87_100719 [Pseudomonas syringae pv. apii]